MRLRMKTWVWPTWKLGWAMCTCNPGAGGRKKRVLRAGQPFEPDADWAPGSVRAPAWLRKHCGKIIHCSSRRPELTSACNSIHEIWHPLLASEDAIHKSNKEKKDGEQLRQTPHVNFRPQNPSSHLHAYPYMHTHVHTYTHLHAYPHMQHTYTHTHIHTCMHVHARMCTCIYTMGWWSVCKYPGMQKSTWSSSTWMMNS